MEKVRGNKSGTRMNADERGLVEEVKRKKEFSGLLDSVVGRALGKSGGDVKEARKWLRKYFGVFLTNRVLKGKGDLLGAHVSSKKRNYEEFYTKIFDGLPLIGSVVDLGCGVNGFSFPLLHENFGVGKYIGVEAAGQVVDLVNMFFEERKLNGKVFCGDLFDLDFIGGILKNGFDVCFLFQVVDALESVEKDFSKKLISLVMRKCDYSVVSLPLVSLGGRKKFEVSRKWLVDWLDENFFVEKDFEMFGERIICVTNKSFVSR